MDCSPFTFDHSIYSSECHSVRSLERSANEHCWWTSLSGRWPIMRNIHAHPQWTNWTDNTVRRMLKMNERKGEEKRDGQTCIVSAPTNEHWPYPMLCRPCYNESNWSTSLMYRIWIAVQRSSPFRYLTFIHLWWRSIFYQPWPVNTTSTRESLSFSTRYQCHSGQKYLDQQPTRSLSLTYSRSISYRVPREHWGAWKCSSEEGTNFAQTTLIDVLWKCADEIRSQWSERFQRRSCRWSVRVLCSRDLSHPRIDHAKPVFIYWKCRGCEVERLLSSDFELLQTLSFECSLSLGKDDESAEQHIWAAQLSKCCRTRLFMSAHPQVTYLLVTKSPFTYVTLVTGKVKVKCHPTLDDDSSKLQTECSSLLFSSLFLINRHRHRQFQRSTRLTEQNKRQTMLWWKTWNR